MSLHRPSLLEALRLAGAAAVAFGASLGLPGAELCGKVTLRGTPPPEVEVDLTNYPDCRKAHPGRLTTCHYVVGPDGGLANVFVYIKQGLEGRAFAAPTNVPVLDQRGCRFHPYVMGVMTNQKFLIRNSEPYMETVVAEPKINRGFTIGQPTPGLVHAARFAKPEVLIRIRCQLHPWEFAFVGVVEHPFFAVTDTNGQFRLPPGLPPGQYVLEAVHPKLGAQSQPVTLPESGTLHVHFTFEVKPQPAKPKN